jgi:NAD+ synthase
MFSEHALDIDAATLTAEVCAAVRMQVLQTLRRRGAVVALSGGVDSSVVASLCVRALGADRVFGLLMPDRDSSPDSLPLAQLVVERLGIQAAVEDVDPILTSVGCYRRQAEAVRVVFPEHRDGNRFKITLASILAAERLNVARLTVEGEDGQPRSSRMPVAAYLQLVAATNFKQRVRTMLEYYHADRLNYAVAGTPNRLEYDQGFFVKQGDGAADIKPIAHVYKTQVYQLAAFLDVPDEIRRRPPTTDTFSMPQTQEEFFFSLPYRQMDLCLYGHNNGVPAAEVAATLGLTEDQVARVYRDIEQKRRSTRYLHTRPLLVAGVPEVTA